MQKNLETSPGSARCRFCKESPSRRVLAEAKSRLLVTFVWLVLISLLRWQWGWSLILFWLGGLTGTFLLDLDHLLYTLLTHPQGVTSLRVRRLLAQKHWRKALILLGDTCRERFQLSFHNALFQLGFYLFCFWVLSSTASLSGAGLVLAMALHLLQDEFRCLFEGQEEFLRRWLFWPLKTKVSLQGQRIFLVIMALLFLGLNWFLL